MFIVVFVVNEKWHFEVKTLGTVRVSDKLGEALKQYRQIGHNLPESGGVLIGSFLNSNGALLIDNFTPPQKSDKQGRHNFYRSEDHNRLVQETWQNSYGKSTFVGLWHTHPEPKPRFSHVDANDWRTALNVCRYEGDFLFFMIVGTTHIRCWVGQKSPFKNSIRLLSEVQFDE